MEHAYILRTIARKVYHTLPVQHPRVVRTEILQYFNTSQTILELFYFDIEDDGFNSESPGTGTASLPFGAEEYLSILAHPKAYAGHIEMAAANNLYNNNIHIVYLIAGSAICLPCLPYSIMSTNYNIIFMLISKLLLRSICVSMSPVHPASN